MSLSNTVDIIFHKGETPQDCRFSILIPTWNNLAYLKKCVESIQVNSSHSHQIILHINEGNDGTEKWALENGLSYSMSRENIGVCKALNSASTLVQTEYTMFMNDDMYVLPEWDKMLLDEINKIGHHRFFLSATMIEPNDTGNEAVIVADFGDDLKTFREQELLIDHSDFEKNDWCGATWPPNVVHKSLWDDVGGYSEEFSPGIGSDPDFTMKVWQAGVREIRGIGKSHVYHFQRKSTGRIERNPGSKQFLEKWGITISVFSKYYLRRGKEWKGVLKEPATSPGLTFGKIKSSIKKKLG